MTSSEINLNVQKIARVILNTFKYMALAGFVYFMIGLSTSIKKNYPLWASPLYAEGRITGHKQKSWQSLGTTSGAYTTTAQLPVVEFRTATNILIEFTDDIGDRVKSNRVPVIYSQEDPSNAKIDNGPLLNWIDVYIFLFGAIGCLLGMVRFTKANIASMLKKLEDKNL